MKALLLCFSLLLQSPSDTVGLMFWNLENFFDWRDGGNGEADAEFSSRGARRWTKKRFRAKSDAVSKTILWAGMPDAVGVAEVENAFVLKEFLGETALRKTDYSAVHFDSPDRRGIDVALLYRKSRLTLLEAKPCHIFAGDSILPTRDILLALFLTPGGEKTALLVNHHPSKYSGSASGPRRELAVKRLKELADSLEAAGISRIVAMGDFNDTPSNPLYSQLEPALVNLAAPLHRRGEGSIKYQGVWELIDLFFVSKDLETSAMKILHPPFLETEDKAYAGKKPLRTYSGPRYLGGVSDHCPIYLEMYIP